MNCSKCGQESFLIGDLWECTGCFRQFNECTCESATPSDASQSGDHLLSPTAIGHQQ